MGKKRTKLQLAQDAAQEAIDKTNQKISELGSYSSELYDALTDIQKVFDNIRNVPSEKKLQYEELKEIRLNWIQQAEKIEQDYKAAEIKNGGAAAAGVGAGVAVVTLGPSVAMGVATTFGVASTGTAISTLSGAAATNAALAWLGGGALTAGGGGMVAGETLLALAGPIGWAIAGVAVLTSGIFMGKSISDKKIIEEVFTRISERDVKSYQLAIVELAERIDRIQDESNKLNEAIVEIEPFGLDYNKMTETQQYALGSYVNLMYSSTQLLINPILGLQPKYIETDLNDYMLWEGKKVNYGSIEKHAKLFTSFANFLYRIKLDDREKKLLWKSFRKNKKMLKAMNLTKKDLEFDLLDAILEALDYKYSVIKNERC